MTFNDDVIGLSLIRQIEYEIGQNQARDTAFHVTVCRSDNLTTAQQARGDITMSWDRLRWADIVCRALNKGARQGGTWIVAWCEPQDRIDRTPKRVLFLWKDGDGDVPICFDCVEPFEDIVSWGPLYWEVHAHKALQQWREHLRDVEVRPDQMIKAAQGQRSAVH